MEKMIAINDLKPGQIIFIATIPPPPLYPVSYEYWIHDITTIRANGERCSSGWIWNQFSGSWVYVQKAPGAAEGILVELSNLSEEMRVRAMPVLKCKLSMELK
jgi:hypothetical protein